MTTTTADLCDKYETAVIFDVKPGTVDSWKSRGLRPVKYDPKSGAALYDPVLVAAWREGNLDKQHWRVGANPEPFPDDYLMTLDMMLDMVGDRIPADATLTQVRAYHADINAAIVWLMLRQDERAKFEPEASIMSQVRDPKLWRTADEWERLAEGVDNADLTKLWNAAHARHFPERKKATTKKKPAKKRSAK